MRGLPARRDGHRCRMKVVVVGGTGNVGERLVGDLVADPGVDTVVAASRREPERLPAGVDWRPVDISRDDPYDVLAGADAVVNLAWLFQPSRRPSTTWSANAVGTARVLDAAARAGVGTVVHASSVGAYSPRVDDRLVDESWPTHGIGAAAYSREKAYAERLLDVFEAEHPTVRVVRMRPAFIFRAEAAVGQRRLFAGPFAPAGLVAEHPPPVLPDPGGAKLQALHTDDVSRAYRLAVVREVSGAFNLAADPVLDMAAVAEAIGARTAVRVPARLVRPAVWAAWKARLVPASPGMLEMFLQIPLLDSSRAREELGWQPQFTAPQALEAMMAGMRAGTGAPTPPLAPETSGPLRAHEVATGVGQRP